MFLRYSPTELAGAVEEGGRVVQLALLDLLVEREHDVGVGVARGGSDRLHRGPPDRLGVLHELAVHPDAEVLGRRQLGEADHLGAVRPASRTYSAAVATFSATSVEKFICTRAQLTFIAFAAPLARDESRR